MSRFVAATVALVAVSLLAACRQSAQSSEIDPSDHRAVVAQAEKQTLAADSVKVTFTWPGQPAGESVVAYWQAPNRVRFGGGDSPVEINVANRMYRQQTDAPDRFDLVVAPGSPSDIERITNFPVAAIGGIASRARDVSFDGATYTAVVPVGDKSFTASMRLSAGFIVWIRVVSPDNETTYELSDFNRTPAVDEPAADKVDKAPSVPSCASASTTRPTTAGSGILDYLCLVDTTTR